VSREDLVDAALSDTLAPVLRDLENSCVSRLEIREEPWSDVPGQVTAMLYGPDGSGQGSPTKSPRSTPSPQRSSPTSPACRIPARRRARRSHQE